MIGFGIIPLNWISKDLILVTHVVYPVNVIDLLAFFFDLQMRRVIKDDFHMGAKKK